MKAIERVQVMQDARDTVGIDDVDRRIIVATQSGLPLVSRPYDVVAEQAGISPAEVKRRIQAMLEQGIIRRIAAVPNHYQLGFKANGMTVWDVPDAMVGELGQQVGALHVVSHCYHRPRHLPDWPYNLFAMVHARSRDEVMHWVAHISQMLGENDRRHDVLFSSRILKKTGIRLKD